MVQSVACPSITGLRLKVRDLLNIELIHQI